MKSKIMFLMLISFLIMLLGCNKKIDNVVSGQSREIITESSNANESHTQSNDQIKENVVYKDNPLNLYREYYFSPILNYNLNLFSIENEINSSINLLYDGECILVIDDMEVKIENVLNLCKSYNNDRLSTSSFKIFTDKIKLCGIIEFNKGVVKIYSWNTEIKNTPFYSGSAKYYLIENTWIEKEEYYDYSTFKTIPASYNGSLLLVDIDTDEIVYSIDRKLLHETMLLSIDKIEYESDDFRITIGNYNDSDEFVDFKIFTDDKNFRYEIYDKYSYSDDE